MEYAFILIALEIALLGFAHYYPHLRALMGKPLEHPVRLKTNYVIGILCIFVPFTIWLRIVFQEGAATYERVALWMWIFIASGGASVWLMYRHDDSVNMSQNLKDEKEKNDLLRKKQDAEPQRK